jgi:uncharacterized protein (DUF1800 family)
MASLNTRQGVLGQRLAAHLLRRATYHVTPERIAAFANMTATQAVQELFNVPPYVHPEGPIDWVNGENTPWLTTGPYEMNPGNGGRQRTAVWFWLVNEMLHDTSIRHKLTIFWHSIFVTEIDTDWRIFDLVRLFQLFALGNVRDLAYKVTLDSKMQRYLNNNTNKKTSPNENYAREFFELFTILKGEQQGDGDYTNYTEHDIQEAARVLTGFRDSNFANKDPETGLATGTAGYSNHDPGNKTFSAAFGYHQILGAFNTQDMYREFKEFVDMIFNKEETARSYVRRLYRFFVSDRLTEEIENDIIAPLASQLYQDGYEIQNTVEILLTSVHFYDEDDNDSSNEVIGGKIKSPLELYLTSINLFSANQMGVLNDDADNYYNTARRFIDNNLFPMGFDFYPRSVEGYPGFYKAPGYSKSWFDQANIASRYKLSYTLLEGRTVKNNNSIPFQTEVVSFFQDTFINHEYADELVQQFLELALPEIPTGERYEYFRQKLLGELSPINWMFEWQGYLGSGDDSAIRVALTDLFEAVVASPEYQTF